MDFWDSFIVGIAVMVISVLIFVVYARKRQWTTAALLVGLIHLPVPLGVNDTPFRAALDPTYSGWPPYGLIHADKGIALVLFSLAILVGGVASACIAVLNRPGERNYFIVAYDSFLLLIWLPFSIANVTEGTLERFQIEFGETVVRGFPAMLFQVSIVLVPPIIGVLWAWRRAKASE